MKIIYQLFIYLLGAIDPIHDFHEMNSRKKIPQIISFSSIPRILILLKIKKMHSLKVHNLKLSLASRIHRKLMNVHENYCLIHYLTPRKIFKNRLQSKH